mmetsp:Transcript_11917/g.32542  ORF Transcript_11917/g.32542 Transcript_11917/m.32542 type:complete len:281 (-) Transcript_11917:1148-1990(-)
MGGKELRLSTTSDTFLASISGCTWLTRRSKSALLPRHILMLNRMRLPYVRVSSPPSFRNPAATLNRRSRHCWLEASMVRTLGCSIMPSRWELTLARTCMLLWLAHAHRAAMARCSETRRHISASARSASAAKKFSRPALEISPAFLRSMGTMSSSSRSNWRPRATNISCMSAMAFLTVKLRSWSRAGTAARTNSCRHGRSTSGWWATMRRESLMASCWPCQSSSLRSALLACIILLMAERRDRSGSGRGMSSAVLSSSKGFMLFSQKPAPVADLALDIGL